MERNDKVFKTTRMTRMTKRRRDSQGVSVGSRDYGDENGPNKKTWVMRQEKVFKGENTASQLREELNVELIYAKANPEQGVINQDATELEQFQRTSRSERCG